jgi:hypothetical protein
VTLGGTDPTAVTAALATRPSMTMPPSRATVRASGVLIRWLLGWALRAGCGGFRSRGLLGLLDGIERFEGHPIVRRAGPRKGERMMWEAFFLGWEALSSKN